MSATVDFFEQDFIVEQYECDCNGRIKPSTLMALCQAISTNHCDGLGMTLEVYRRTHTVFLLAKASLEIYHDIKVGEKLHVTTRPSGPERAIYNRYTSFVNEQGAEVAAQDAKWVLVDTDSWKILRDPPEELHSPFHIQELPKQDLSIPKVRDAQQVAVERVTYSRTDNNGHLNNTQYADLILDNLPFSATAQRKLDKLVINYHNEAKMGEELAILVKELGEADKIPAGEVGYYVAGVKPDGKKCFESLARFC